MTNVNPSLLKTKQHFNILDGLRGVAALAIVAFHFMEVVFEFSKNILGHGFLAVDFFFCLSGFVIAYAYDDRLEKMGIMEFFKSRVIRLHPLVIFGSVLGLLTFLFDPFSGTAAQYSIGKITLLFLTSALLIPFPTMEDRYFNNFGLNAPAWSLFWEYVANIFYAFVLYKLPKKFLIVLACTAAVILIGVAYHAGSLLGGWAGENFWEGGARIFYSFIAGLIIYRYNWIIKNKLGFIGLSILLLLAFFMPYSSYNWLTESFVVVIYFPLLVSLGAGTVATQGLHKLCIFSGKISYPLYMTHYMAIWIFANYYNTYKPEGLKLALVISCGIIALVSLAYLTMILFDIPIRKYLSKKRIKA
ncbi:acyltransferase family protein [Pedobacter agri]|uniref:acyltransferase family protein n=1 Tax=Pedobacter agri TaxID=454586 RepID=UPI002783A3CF|nr:acyltransferase [Pedobacter agri]MDQ1140688.1 peptidoglycan/LPS O-acetylase OafA/YrhL [Pedobacter agri]